MLQLLHLMPCVSLPVCDCLQSPACFALVCAAGLLVEVLRAALDLGIQPADATLKALLTTCEDLESRPGKSPLGLAAGPGFELQGFGYVDLGQVLDACREALRGQQGQLERPGAQNAGGYGSSKHGAQVATVGVTVSPGSVFGQGEAADMRVDEELQARQLAARLLRTWVFHSTFDQVKGVRSHGPTWPLAAAAATAGCGAGDTAEVSLAVGA